MTVQGGNPGRSERGGLGLEQQCWGGVCKGQACCYIFFTAVGLMVAQGLVLDCSGGVGSMREGGGLARAVA